MTKQLLLTILTLFLFSCKPDEGTDPQPLAAHFTIQNDKCIAACNISFTNSSVNAVSYLWDFGDGQSSTEENPVHEYLFSGEYQVQLTAKAADGTEAKASRLVKIAAQNPFITGLDLSYQPFLESRNVAYKDEAGQAIGDLVSWTQANGVNLVRLRLFHTPTSADPGVAFSNLERVLAYAKRVKASGNPFLLDIHYSDTWADPGSQIKPAAWSALSFEVLKDSVYAYTRRVLQTFEKEGALPDFMQIGNETNPGFIWPEGRLDWNDNSSWQKYVELVHAARRAVLEVEQESGKDIQTLIHYAGIENAPAFFEKLKTEQALFDIVGLSHYAYFHSQNMALIQQRLRELATSIQKPILIVETNYPFTLNWNDWTNNVVGEEGHLVNGYPATPAGQKAYYDFWVQILKNVPEGLGMGFVWWAPDLVAFDGAQSPNGSAFENVCIFDFDNKALPVMDVFREN